MHISYNVLIQYFDTLVKEEIMEERDCEKRLYNIIYKIKNCLI